MSGRKLFFALSTLVCGTGSTFVRASASSWVCGTVTEMPVQSLALAAGAESRAEAASEEASGSMRMPSKAPFEARRMEISGILWFFMIFLLSVFKNSLRGKRRKMRGATKNIIPHPDGFCNPGLKKSIKKQLVNLQFILRTQANEKNFVKSRKKGILLLTIVRKYGIMDSGMNRRSVTGIGLPVSPKILEK